MRFTNFSVCTVIMVATLALTGPAHAATMEIGARLNCECFPVMGDLEFCFCYFQGSVTFTDPDHGLETVECWVAGNQAGTQFGGFSEPVDQTYGYAKCSISQSKETGTGPYSTTDKAFGKHANGQSLGLVAQDSANWSP